MFEKMTNIFLIHLGITILISLTAKTESHEASSLKIVFY